MSYYFGSVAAVPDENRQAYIDYAKQAWALFATYGATRMIENWGVDVTPGKVTDFQRAVQAKAGETIVFSWIEWPDKQTADAAWEKMKNDPDMSMMSTMPFDGSRMIYGGFDTIFDSASA